jgi:predicted RND superfamily exporter protein
MKRTFFARYALLIICIICFLGPFALRGARMSMQRMTNRVKDWLPSDFAETADLEWFGRHFMGEQFVIVTWPGCSEEDPRYQKLVDRIQHQLAPPEHDEHGGPAEALAALARRPFEELTPDERLALDRQRAGELGDQLGLCTTGDYHENWGRRGEKWLRGDHDLWYFITPEGQLYRWAGRSNMLNWMYRTFQTTVLGQTEAEGEMVACFGLPPAPEQTNEFHDNPELLMARLFKSITTGPDTLKQLSRKDGPLWPRGVDDEFAAKEAHQLALDRLTGALFGADGEQTCIMLTFSEVGKRDLRRVIGRQLMGRPLGRLRQLATTECGISEEDLKLGGPPVDNVAIDEEGQITLARLIVLSAIVGIVLSLLLVRSVRVTCILFFIGGLSALNCLAIVWWTGGTVDAIMMSMPSLVYVLAISGALHLVNYYRETVDEEGLAGGPGRMLKLGWKAAFLCAISTSLGLISLYTSTLIPIRNFGVYSAIGVLATCVLFFTFLPAALQLWPPRVPDKAKAKTRTEPTRFEKGVEHAFERLGGFIIRRWGLVTVGCLLVIGGCSLGLFHMQTSVHLIKFFDRNAKIIRDYTWLETNLAKLVPMELVVRVRPELIRSTTPAGESREADGSSEADAAALRRERLQLDFLERMEIASRIQDAVARQLGEQGQGVVGQAMSVPTFAPELPPPGYPTMRDPVRSVMNRKLEEHRGEYLTSDYLRIDRGPDPKAGGQGGEGAGRKNPNLGSELWRISLRVGALRDIDYGAFVGELKRVVEPVLTAYRFREHVLSELDAHSDGKGFVKTRVAFLGLSEPAEGRAKPAEADNADEQAGAPAAEDLAAELDHKYEGPGTVDQTQLFSQTLKDLMTCAGVIAKGGCWHNPDKAPQDDPNYYSSDAWANLLGKKFDCVVLVRDSPAYDVEFIKQHARIFIDARQHGFDPALPQAQTAVQRSEPIHVVYTGVVPLVYKAQRSLLDSLIQSTLWSFITITPLMMFLARNIIAGIVVMLPNVLPVVVIFGGMGLLGIDVDVGSMMTASIALGVAVDDTIHFLTWYRDDYERLGDRNQAIIAAYRRCALPTMQAAAISGVGLSVFALSTFTPTQRFGYLMLTILFAGLVAELIMLPALLAGPLGRFCNPRQSRKARAAGTPPAEPGSAQTKPADAEAPADGGFAQPHITGDARTARQGALRRRDRGHDTRGR